MAKNAAGFLIYFDEEQRKDLIQENIDGSYETFSDALSVRDWELKQLSIAILSFSESTIDYIALVKKGKKVVTSKFRAVFSEIVPLQAISIDDVESRINERLRKHFIRTSKGIGGTVPTKAWAALIDTIKLIRPKLSNEIDRLLSLTRYSGFCLSGNAAEVLLQEREALGAALDIFSGGNQLRERVLSSWAPAKDSITEDNHTEASGKIIKLEPGNSSFLKGISQRYLQEESALQHDLFNWDDITPVHEAGISIFEQGTRRLEVIYSNRNALEHTLGVDLIYYNSFYELFVLVQYKLMREEGYEIAYRPDAQLRSELNRMDSFSSSFQRTRAIQSHEEYRLNNDGFLFKLVPNKGLRPASGELIKGMYLTREYVHFLLGPNGPKGSQGGTSLTFNNAPRYLSNSEFTQGINRGWIGTSGVQSQAVHHLIKQYYETGRALLVAFEMA